MKNIKLFDLKIKNKLKNEIVKSIENNINNSDFVRGKNIKIFEERFKKKIESKHCISCNSGTDALFLILKSLDIKKGDEIITTCHSWISTSETILNVGAKPVFVDADEDFNINPKLIEKKITRKTKAILIVHLYGLPCNMDKIIKLCKKKNLKLVEDCAQAHFSKYKNKYVGNFGIASAFSFFPTKNLGSFGDAGCVITNNSKIANKVRMIANHGYKKKNEFEIDGINSRMDTIQASVLLQKLNQINNEINHKTKLAKIYYKNLKNIKEVLIHIPPKHVKHSYYLFTIKVQKRKKLIKYLRDRGIETGIYYPKLLPFQKVYKKFNYSKKNFKISTKNNKKILSLPLNPNLSSRDIKYCCLQIKNFYSQQNL